MSHSLETIAVAPTLQWKHLNSTFWRGIHILLTIQLMKSIFTYKVDLMLLPVLHFSSSFSFSTSKRTSQTSDVLQVCLQQHDVSIQPRTTPQSISTSFPEMTSPPVLVGPWEALSTLFWRTHGKNNNAHTGMLHRRLPSILVPVISPFHVTLSYCLSVTKPHLSEQMESVN